MERLTERFENGQVGVAVCGKNCKHDHKFCENAREDCPTFEDIYEKLATYEDAEEQGLPIRWIPVDEKLPDVDEYIIVSFENFTVPMIGRYTVDDDDNGTFRIGDEDESFVENDLYVNAWMPLPKPYRESEE